MSIIRKSIAIILGVAMVLSGAVYSFADTDTTATLKVIVGENGTVNGKTGTWTQEVKKDSETVDLQVQANEGYIVDKVYQVADSGEETDVSDSATEIVGKASGTLTIPELSDNAAFKITFKSGTASGGSTTPEQPTNTDTEYTISITVDDPELATIMSSATKYKSSDPIEEREIAVVAKEQADGSLPTIKKVTINGTEDPSYVGKPTFTYTLTSGNMDIKVFYKGDSSSGGDTPSTDGTFTVTTKAGEHGAIGGKTGNSSIEYKGGENTEISWVADAGYVIDTVKIDGIEKTTADNVGIGTAFGSTTFASGNHEIEVTFKVETASTDASGDGGTINISMDKKMPNVNDEVTITINVTPKGTEKETTYNISTEGFEIISSDDGTVSGTSVTGTIPAGTEKKTITLKAKAVTAGTAKIAMTTKYDNGETTANLESTIIDPSGNTDPNTNPEGVVDLTGGTLGVLVDGAFIEYVAPEGDGDDYFNSMTQIEITSGSSVKPAIQKDGNTYEVATCNVVGGEEGESISGQALWDNGTEVATEGLEDFKAVVIGGNFDVNKYNVPAELHPAAMNFLVTLLDENAEDESIDDSSVVEDTGSSDKANASDKVKTGDETNVLPFAFAGILSALLLTVLFIRRRLTK